MSSNHERSRCCRYCFGKYVGPQMKTVPVNYLATLDITGGNSGSAALNKRGELIGLAFDGGQPAE